MPLAKPSAALVDTGIHRVIDRPQKMNSVHSANRFTPSPSLEPQDRSAILDASREMFQHGLCEIVRQAEVGSPEWFVAFSEAIGRSHDALVKSDIEDGFAESSDLTSSRMTLMADSDLEFDIRIGEIAKQLHDVGGRDLWRTQTRYMTLLQKPTMTADNHPLGPETISAGLWVIARQSEGSSERTLALLDHLADLFNEHLPALYRRIDQLLASRGAMPAVDTKIFGRPSNQSTAHGATSAIVDTLAALRLALAGQSRGAASTPSIGGLEVQIEGNRLFDANAMVTLNRLLDHLTALQKNGQTPGTASTGIAGEQTLNPLKADDLSLPPGGPEAVAIDTLALVFKGIFELPELPYSIKTTIAGLQIPLLKRAIIDPSLFTDGQHPARGLINRIGNAALGLPREVGHQHPVYQRIAQVCASAEQALADQNQSLDIQLAELDQLIVERDREILKAAQPLVTLIEAHEKNIYADRLTDQWLDNCLAKTTSPEIATFLDSYWRRVMIAAAKAGGNRWQECQATAEELIWSATPKYSAEERKRLAGLASSLIKRLNAGLDSIAVTAIERRPFMNILFDLQTAALRTPTGNAPVSAPPPPVSTPTIAARRTAMSPNPKQTENSEAQLIENEGHHVHYLGINSATRLPATLSSEHWQIGDWLRFHLANQPSSTGFCCWQSPLSGVVLLYSRQWRSALARPPAWVDAQLRAGQATVISRQALFDLAVEHALSTFKTR